MGTFAETAIVDYCLSFTKNKWKFAVSVFCLQQTNRNCHFPLVPFSVYIYIYLLKRQHVYRYKDVIYIYIYICLFCLCCRKKKKKNGSLGNFPSSVYHLLIVQTEVCNLWLVYEETNESYLSANGLNGLTYLCT